MVDLYQKAGVDRDLADRFAEKIGVLSKSVKDKKVKGGVGGYASLYEISKTQWIAATTDGVGTKLKLAIDLKKHDTVGIDLVAMSVNDLVCVGALPLFFLDYFATGKLESEVAEAVIKGIVEGCRLAQCSLVGGETAEMPGMYAENDYDLAGFAVGMVAPKRVLPQRTIKPGDALIGVASSGFHSNGYSLLRRLLDDSRATRETREQVFTPTKIYVKAMKSLLEKNLIRGAAHITGSGFLNVPRMSTAVSYEITLRPWSEMPSPYQWLRIISHGMDLAALSTTFNMGLGMVLCVEQKRVAQVLKLLKSAGESAYVVGTTTKKDKKKLSAIQCEVGITHESQRIVLSY